MITAGRAAAQSIFPAIERGDRGALRRLIEGNPATLKDTTFGGNTPLHYALARPEQTEIIRLLLELGADPNARNASGAPPLHFLLDVGARNRPDSTVIEAARILIEEGAEADGEDAAGIPPMIRALPRRSIPIIAALIEAGANINVTASGWTAVDVAIGRNDTTLARYLESRGGVQTGRSEIFSAVLRADTALLAAMLKEDPSLTRSTTIEGASLLHVAATVRDTSVAGLILRRGATTSARDGKRRTPLHWAAVAGNTAAVELLLARKADIEARDVTGLTPLAMNHEGEDRGNSGQLDAARALIRLGADLDAIDFHNSVPLHHAAAAGELAKVKLLLESGASPRLKNSDSLAPLHFAVSLPASLNANQLAVVKALIDKGGDVNVVNLSRITPLHSLLLRSGTDEENEVLTVAKLLVGARADLNIQDVDGRTPISLARAKRYTRVVDLLRRGGARE